MTASAGAGAPPKPRLLAVVSSIGPPVTVISSVLVFFGWVKADAEAKYMGLNVSLFGYTTQDYVFFSLSNLSIALICLFRRGYLVHGPGPLAGPPDERWRDSCDFLFR